MLLYIRRLRSLFHLSIAISCNYITYERFFYRYYMEKKNSLYDKRWEGFILIFFNTVFNIVGISKTFDIYRIQMLMFKLSEGGRDV